MTFIVIDIFCTRAIKAATDVALENASVFALTAEMS
jgi:hypothetical protein